MDELEIFFTVAMWGLVVVIPVGLTLIVGSLLRAASGGGLAGPGVVLPPDPTARAAMTSARVRAHLRRVGPLPSAASVPFLRVLPSPPPVADSEAGEVPAHAA